MPIPQATAASIEQRDSPMTSHFRFGLHKEKEIDLTPLQKPAGRVLKFKAESAVRKQKWEEEGLKDGKPPSELDQAAAEIWKKLQENDGDLSVLSVGEIGQVYFIFRDIDKQGVRGEYFQDAVRNIRDVKEKRKIWNREKTQTKIILTNLEERLVGRPYWKEVLGWKTPEARNLLVLEDLIKKHGGNIEKAAASFATDQIEAVLGERVEEVKERMGADKIEAAKKSSRPEHRRIAQAIEGSSDLAAKGVKKRKEIAKWTEAEEFRKFVNPQLTKTELSDAEIVLSSLDNNPDLLEAMSKAPGIRRLVSSMGVSRIADLPKTDLKEWLAQQTDATKIEQLADGVVTLLVRKHSFNSVVDTAYSTLERLGERLPAEEVRIKPRVELSTEAGRNAREGDIVLAIARGIPEQEMRNKGFDSQAIERIRKKYFYKDAAGQYQLKKMEDDGAVDTEKETKKKALYQTKYKKEVDSEITKYAQELVGRELVDFEAGTQPAGITDSFEDSMKQAAVALNLRESQVIRGGNPDTPWTPASIGEIQSSGKLADVQREWIRQRVASQYSSAWRSRDITIVEGFDRFIAKPENDKAAKDYHESVEMIKVGDMAGVGAETFAVLEVDNKLVGSKIDEVKTAVGDTDVEKLIDRTDPAAIKLQKGEDLAAALAQRPGVPFTSWAMMIRLGFMNVDQAVEALLSTDRGQEEEDLKKMLV